MPSGGANGGPQYSSSNVKGQGGDGQSGKSPDYSGFAYGQNQALAEQKSAAPIKATSNANMRESRVPGLSAITPLTAPTELPGQDVMHGTNSHQGSPNVLDSLPQQQTDPDKQDMMNNLPILEFWASQPGATQSTKDYVQYLRTTLGNKPMGMPI
jgi:hypothetical protein